MYDIVVIGGGIAGLTAGLVSARAGRRTRVLTGPALGGHLLSIERIEGYPGFPEGIPGYDLCPIVQEQATAAGSEFSATMATKLEAQGTGWRVTTAAGDEDAGAVVIATGTKSRELGIPGEARLRGKGVSHCATCDGPLLRTRVVGVVGGGDSAMQEALTLTQFASRVILFHRGTALSGQDAYRRQVLEHAAIDVRFGTTVEEALGDPAMTGVRTRSPDGSLTEVELAALFVYVGLDPDTAWLGGLLDLDDSGRVPTDGSMRCRPPGLFAVGTVRAGSAGRAAAAAGDGATAAVAANQYLNDGLWPE